MGFGWLVFVGFLLCGFVGLSLITEETITQSHIKKGKKRLRRVKKVMRVNAKESEGMRGLLRQRASEGNKLAGCISQSFF